MLRIHASTVTPESGSDSDSVYHLKTPSLGHGLLGIATLNSPARVSLPGIFLLFYQAFLFLVVCDGGQVGLGGFTTDQCFSYKL